MIRVVAKVVIRNDKIDEFLALSKDLVAKSRSEAGCKAYDLARSKENGNVFCFIEAWESDEVLALHGTQSYFKDAMAKMEPLPSQSPSVEVYCEL